MLANNPSDSSSLVSSREARFALFPNEKVGQRSNIYYHHDRPFRNLDCFASSPCVLVLNLLPWLLCFYACVIYDSARRGATVGFISRSGSTQTGASCRTVRLSRTTSNQVRNWFYKSRAAPYQPNFTRFGTARRDL